MNEKTESHAALSTLEYEDGVLVWGGRKLTDVAAELGRTPFYAYDRERIAKRVAELRKALPPEMHIHYAMKANPMPDIVAFLVEHVEAIAFATA